MLDHVANNTNDANFSHLMHISKIHGFIRLAIPILDVAVD